MKVAVYSKKQSPETMPFIQKVLSCLKKSGCEILLHSLFAQDWQENDSPYPTFSSHCDLLEQGPVDYLFSLGGDGTFLDAANIVGDAGIPLVGINTGRIGFLTSITKANFEESFALLLKNEYEIEERSLLHVECDAPDFLSTRFALNDVTIHPSADGSINSISVWMDDEVINTYWADGLIVATPTGSTAYSLSCGGPILPPSADGVVVTPIASHSLSVRPIVLPASATLKIKVESRTRQFALSLDSHKVQLSHSHTITITKENFKIRSVRFHSADFFSVIREKLLWGIDKRNLLDIE